MKNWMKNFFYLDEEEEASETQQSRPQQQKTSDNNIKQQTAKSVPKERKFNTTPKEINTPNLVSIQNVQKSSKVILIEPRVYAEAQDISEHLKSR